MRQRLWGRLMWWAVFAASFGYVEALVVVYLRRLTGMPPGWGYRAIWHGWGLPLTSAAIFHKMAAEQILKPEISREISTLLLLLGAAMAAGRTARERLGLFAWTFALWDLFYYLWLKLWTGFPQHLSSTDIYYLVPVAWYGPVWFPVLIFMPLTLLLALWLLTPAQTPLRPENLPDDPNA